MSSLPPSAALAVASAVTLLALYFGFGQVDRWRKRAEARRRGQ